MKLLSFLIMFYMVMALLWWSVLLKRNYDTILDQKVELLSFKEVNVDERQKMANDYRLENKKKKLMIIGEGLVFGGMLIVGLWFIQRTYQKEYQNRIQQKNFLLSVTHELKTPLSAIRLITETLLKRDIKPENQKDLFSDILHEEKRLESMVSNLLLAAKLESKYQYNFEQANIIDTCQEVIKSIHISYPNRIVELQYDKNPLFINFDKESIFSLFNNIVENALKYSEKDTKVVIKVNTLETSHQISIVDFGIGIAEDERTKVFDQFYRSENEEIRKTKGTGLGLYIAKKIVDAHMGKIRIESNHPQGTIIKINLPLLS